MATCRDENNLLDYPLTLCPVAAATAPVHRLRVALSVARSKRCLLSASVADRAVCAAGAMDRSRDLRARIGAYRVSPDPPVGR